MKYAITPQGIGKIPGARAIHDGEALSPGETFAVPEGAYNPKWVLAEDGVSLRPKSVGELDAESAAGVAETAAVDSRAALLADAKADPIFDALKTATAAQISAFINTHFAGFTAQQRAFLKLLAQVAALFLRR